MAATLLVSTRKGLFVLRRAGGAWRIDAKHFLGDNVALCLCDPRDGNWYAVLDLGHFGCKLRRSGDRGASWQECSVPAFDAHDQVATGDGKPPLPASLRLIWALEAGGSGQPGRLWAGTIPGGLFRSEDGAASWQLQRGLWDRPERLGWFGGGYDQPGIHSICIDPRDPRRVCVAVSTGGVWRSDDDGANWRQCAHGMRTAYMPPERSHDPEVQDVHRMVQCRGAPNTFWVQHHNGVFKSRSGAENWQELDKLEPSAFGFAVAVHPRDPDTAWFVPATRDVQRIPVDARVVVIRTRDGGARFDILRHGLPQYEAYDLTLRHALALDATGQALAFGSSTGGFWTSDDQGDRWQALDARLPPIYAVTFAND